MAADYREQLKLDVEIQNSRIIQIIKFIIDDFVKPALASLGP